MECGTMTASKSGARGGQRSPRVRVQPARRNADHVARQSLELFDLGDAC
jgi:hypothetical protein